MSGAKIVHEWEFAMVPAAVLKGDVSANAKLLFTLYCLHASKEGSLHPGNRRLCELMGGVSEDTLRRAKKELLDAGHIRVEARYLEGRRTTDQVWLLHRTGAGRPPSDATYVPPSFAGTEVDPEEPEKTFPPHRTAAGQDRASVGRPATATSPDGAVAGPQQGRQGSDEYDAIRRPLDDDDRRRARRHLAELRLTQKAPSCSDS